MGWAGDPKINLIGTSQGGAAILQYFADSMNGQYNIDSRIASFVTVEGNLDAVANAPTGAWLAAHTQIRTGSGYDRDTETALTVDGHLDSINHRPISGIDYEGNPDYPNDPVWRQDLPSGGPSVALVPALLSFVDWRARGCSNTYIPKSCLAVDALAK